MKKFLALTLAMLTCASLGACGDSNSSQGSFIPEPSNQEDQIEPEALPERDGLQFRRAKWTDDIETVKSYEDAELIYDEDEQTIMFAGNVAGLEANIIYYFDPQYGLYRGLYGITEEHTTTLNYITDYKTLKESLTHVYGQPVSDEIIPISSLAEYADDEQALSLGYVVYATDWELDGTNITLTMSSDNYAISTIVFYEATDFTPAPNTDGL